LEGQKKNERIYVDFTDQILRDIFCIELLNIKIVIFLENEQEVEIMVSKLNQDINL
jgi:hypothetical protein